MQTLQIGKSQRRKKMAVSSVVGGVMIFGIIFSVGFGYFYTTNQQQQILQTAQKQSANLVSLKDQESMYIQANLTAQGNLTFTVHNTGISTNVTAYFVSNQTGMMQDLTGSAQSTPFLPCSSTIQPTRLPYELDPGAAICIVPNPQIYYISGNSYTFKVVTSRGSTFIGTYPSPTLTVTSLNSLVASGLGSLEMIFSSFNFYSYTVSNPCASGNACKISLASTQPAALTPCTSSGGAKTNICTSTTSNWIVFSAQITNNDPSAGTIVINSHTDLWTFLSCGSGCGTQTLLAFYVMNVASDGTITSTGGSNSPFVPIQIPYGTSKTIYFGSNCDLGLNSCTAYSPQEINDNVGEHDVFLIFAGTVITVQGASLYSQNLPFAATFSSDNIATFSETPTTCGNGTMSFFTLSITNSPWSPSGDNINQVVVQAKSFTLLSATGGSINSNTGTITWSGLSIPPGQTQTLTWSGKSPTVHVGTEVVFNSTVSWTQGAILSQLTDPGCFVS